MNQGQVACTVCQTCCGDTCGGGMYISSIHDMMYITIHACGQLQLTRM